MTNNPFILKKFPQNIHPRQLQLIKTLKQINAKLEIELGDAYHGLSLGGSFAGGYLHDNSDVDLRVVVDEKKLWEKVLTERKNKEKKNTSLPLKAEDEMHAAILVQEWAGNELHRNGFAIDRVLHPIPISAMLKAVSEKKENELQGRSRGGSPFGGGGIIGGREDPHYEGWIRFMAGLFSLSAGRKINVARKNLLETINKRKDRTKIWELIRQKHLETILQPIDHAGTHGKKLYKKIAEMQPNHAERINEIKDMFRKSTRLRKKYARRPLTKLAEWTYPTIIIDERIRRHKLPTLTNAIRFYRNK